jgi:hypothetical protein
VSDQTASWQELEAAALDAALEARRHIRGCRTCQAGATVCATGGRLILATDRGISRLGDRMAARARVAAALKG